MSRKFFSYSEIIKSGDKMSKVQILKTWKWKHSSYWEFSTNERDLKEFKQNFDDKVRGVDLAVDVGHDFNHKAVGWFKELMIEGKKLFATIEWNHEGLYLVKEKVYKYFSPELHFEFQDEETGKVIKNLLSGWGITNRPFFKNMEALEASEEGDTQNKWKHYYFLPWQVRHWFFPDVVVNNILNQNKPIQHQVLHLLMAVQLLISVEMEQHWKMVSI